MAFWNRKKKNDETPKPAPETVTIAGSDFVITDETTNGEAKYTITYPTDLNFKQISFVHNKLFELSTEKFGAEVRANADQNHNTKSITIDTDYTPGQQEGMEANDRDSNIQKPDMQSVKQVLTRLAQAYPNIESLNHAISEENARETQSEDRRQMKQIKTETIGIRNAIADPISNFISSLTAEDLEAWHAKINGGIQEVSTELAQKIYAFTSNLELAIAEHLSEQESKKQR